MRECVTLMCVIRFRVCVRVFVGSISIGGVCQICDIITRRFIDCICVSVRNIFTVRLRIVCFLKKSLFITVCGVRVRFILNDNEQNDFKVDALVIDQIFIDFVNWTVKLVKRRRSIPIKWLSVRPWVRLFETDFSYFILWNYFSKIIYLSIYQRLLFKFYFLSRKTVFLSIQSWVWTYAF